KIPGRINASSESIGAPRPQIQEKERSARHLKKGSLCSEPRTPNSEPQTPNPKPPSTMCGIAGFIGTGERLDLERMIDALAHRGPDGAGIWIDQQVFFGHRRLSILDLTGGAQPMITADQRLVVTFNGEIYNHAELRKELEKLGHRFQTDHS